MNDDSDFPGDRPFPTETAKKQNQVVKASAQALSAAVPATPMELLASAIERGMAPEMIEKLMGLQERYEANQARKEYDHAMAAAKAEIPPIIKNRKVGFDSKDKQSRVDYKHEDLAEIARTVDPILAKHGLAYRWRVSSEINKPISVTCVVSHRLGHSEENGLTAGADSGAGKNSIQAIGSTVTYLQRYTLKASLGLSVANDDDGKASETIEYITDEQTANLKKLIEDTGGDIALFCKFCQVSELGNIYANRYEAAVKVVEDTAKKRKAAVAKTKGAK